MSKTDEAVHRRKIIAAEKRDTQNTLLFTQIAFSSFQYSTVSKSRRKLILISHNWLYRLIGSMSARSGKQGNKAAKIVKKVVQEVKKEKRKKQRKSKPIVGYRVPPTMMNIARQHQMRASARQENPANRITLGFTLPHLFPTPRQATAFNADPTAIANPFTLVPATWNNAKHSNVTPPSNLLVSDGQYMAGASRAPLQAQVEWKVYADDQSSQYDAYFVDESNPGEFTSRDYAWLVFSDSNVETSLEGYSDPHFMKLNDAESDVNPHGQYYYNVDAAGRKGFWHDGSISAGYRSVVKIEVFQAQTAISPGGHMSFFLDKWDGSGWRPTPMLVERMDIAGNTDEIEIGEYGYYSLRWSFTGKATGWGKSQCPFSWSIVHYGSGFGFSPIPRFDTVATSLSDVRVPAVSIMLTQNSTVLTKGGSVTGVQLPPTEPWFSGFKDGDPYSTISKLRGAYSDVLEKGIYGFMCPNDTPELGIQQPVYLDGETIVGYFNPIKPVGGWILVAALVTADGTSTGGDFTTTQYPGGSAYLTTTHGVEFVTNNIWFSSGVPSYRADTYLRAVEALKTQVQWHENPLHIKDLFRSALGAGKKVVKMAPSILKMLSLLAPELAPAAAVSSAIETIAHAV